jgi:hypothetical protein
MQRLAKQASRAELSVGTSVEVRDRFCGSWARGFEIAEITHNGYLVRRLSDGYVLPSEFAAHEAKACITLSQEQRSTRGVLDLEREAAAEQAGEAMTAGLARQISEEAERSTESAD